MYDISKQNGISEDFLMITFISDEGISRTETTNVFFDIFMEIQAKHWLKRVDKRYFCSTSHY